jgi:hypothetical protein
MVHMGFGGRTSKLAAAGRAAGGIAQTTTRALKPGVELILPVWVLLNESARPVAFAQ